MKDCDYCHGTGEVPESSTRYMTCPKCCGKCSLEDPEAPRPVPIPPRPPEPAQASLFGAADVAAFDPK